MEKQNEKSVSEDMTRPRLVALRLAAIVAGLQAAAWLIHDYAAEAVSTTSRVTLAGLADFQLPVAVPRAADAVVTFALAYVLCRMIPTKRSAAANPGSLMGASFALVVGTVGLPLGLIALSGKMAIGYLMLTLAIVAAIALGKALLFGVQFHLPILRVALSYGLHVSLTSAVALMATGGIEFALPAVFVFVVMCLMAGNPIKVINQPLDADEHAAIEEWAKGMGEIKRGGSVDPNYDRREKPAVPEYDASRWRSSSRINDSLLSLY